jgi:hypothetical protein
VPHVERQASQAFSEWEHPLSFDLPREELGGRSLSELGKIPFDDSASSSRLSPFRTATRVTT